MKFRYLILILFVLTFGVSKGQILINEVLSLNSSGITDEDQENTDWIELYNASDITVNLEGYVLKDDFTDSVGWIFPAFEFEAKSHLLIFASGKDRNIVSLKYKTLIRQGDDWHYVVPPDSRADGAWRHPDFDASDWEMGTSGFGYGDGDDATVLNPLESIYIRKEFELDDVAAIHELLLHVDYDDGFIAFINGVQVASENVNVPGDGNFNNCQSDGGLHEAEMYNGGLPVRYTLDFENLPLQKGTNVLAIQGYNSNSNSSDFSLIPFLTIGSSNYSFNDVVDFINTEGGGLHSNFKIKNEGESLYLFDSGMQLIDSIWVVELPADVSYGRYEDGSNNWFYFPTPSPGLTNNNPTEVLRNDSIIFSDPAGFYKQEIYLEMNADVSDVVIKYTTDGTDPTVESSSYESPVLLNSVTTVKAATFVEGVKSSVVFTQSYLIHAEHILPVVSLSTDPVNLFDYYEGIFALGPNAESSNPNFGANFWMDWEKPINIEYFDEAGDQKINQMAGVKVFGMWSRANPQKSVALYSRKQYGKGSFKHKLFKDRENDKYETFLLRNSGNDFSYTTLRDGLTSEIAKNLDIDRLAFQPAVVYINGVYWGIMNMREKPNEHYFEANYGVSEGKLNLVDNERIAIHGTQDDYNELNSFLSSKSVLNEKNYNEAERMIDVNSFIDYELLQIYIANTDWPGNNIKFWSTTNSHSKIRMLLYDTDFGFGIFDSNAYRHNTLSFATDPNGPGWPNPPWSTLFLRKLLTNDIFKDQFINRFADLMNTDLSKNSVSEKLDSMLTLIYPELPGHLERWGRDMNNYESRLSEVEKFIDLRSTNIKTHFKNYFELSGSGSVRLTVSDSLEGQIKVNSIVPKTYPYQGTYFSDVPITFKALPKKGYRFVRWEGASESDKTDLKLTIQNGIKLHAVFEPATEVNYNVVINEINYFSNDDFDSGDWVELFNASSQTIDLSGWLLSASDVANAYVFPDGYLLYPNSYLVVCRNLYKFKQVYPSIKNVLGEFAFGLSSKGDLIELLDANDNVVDKVSYETRAPWAIEPVTSSATLELLNYLYDNNDYRNWEAGDLGGTPGAQNGTFTSNELIISGATSPSCFPTRFADYTTLRFHSNGSSGYRIHLMDIQGNVLQNFEGDFQSEGMHYLDLFTEAGSYPRGIYLVKVQTGSLVKTIKVVKL